MSTYLVHYGYCATAESFARNTGQSFDEEVASLKNRQSNPFSILCDLTSEVAQDVVHYESHLIHGTKNINEEKGSKI